MQAVHRQIPILIKALGSSYSELLEIISDPPPGSENLLTQVCSDVLNLLKTFKIFPSKIQLLRTVTLISIQWPGATHSIRGDNSSIRFSCDC